MSLLEKMQEDSTTYVENLNEWVKLMLLFANHERTKLHTAVTKEFESRETYHKVLKIYKKFSITQVCPKLLCYNGEQQMIVIDNFTPLKDFMETKPSYQIKKLIAKRLMKKLEKIFNEGFQHNDIHEGNIIINPKDLQPMIIDFENITRHNKEWNFMECPDILGDEPNRTRSGFDSDIKESLKVVLGFESKEIIKEIHPDWYEKPKKEVLIFRKLHREVEKKEEIEEIKKNDIQE